MVQILKENQKYEELIFVEINGGEIMLGYDIDELR
jgi:hypothetical protein